jgi:hypothetical protein
MVTAAEKAAANKSTSAITKDGAKTNLKLVATNAAVARLKAAHHDEFESMMVEECAKRGITYTPPLTEEQKAHKQILDLIAKHGESVIPQSEEVRAALGFGSEVDVDPIAAPAEDPEPVDVD